ncbi:SRPBCC domain-containing protein [Nonomuraea sp. NPDC050536]|uniref:SRPBCC domain-containing protein n=1 Tax=Nonomuraea sp. NPDC050536 TaxID=3364366 RepID=UPI0037CBB345
MEYTRHLTIQAGRERVFGAIASLEGPRRWWTTLVYGSAELGGRLTFGFAGLAEQIVMRVDAVEPPSLVRWSCTAHTRDDEWTGTQLRFELAERGAQACELRFQHVGIPPEAVADGWERFLASLAAEAERAEGRPFGV